MRAQLMYHVAASRVNVDGLPGRWQVVLQFVAGKSCVHAAGRARCRHTGI